MKPLALSRGGGERKCSALLHRLLRKLLYAKVEWRGAKDEPQKHLLQRKELDGA